MTKKIIGGDPRIVSIGTALRPYYQIEYYDGKDGNTHVGFGSKFLSVVRQYLTDYFEDGEQE